MVSPGRIWDREGREGIVGSKKRRLEEFLLSLVLVIIDTNRCRKSAAAS
jgi:hypothetical protein